MFDRRTFLAALAAAGLTHAPTWAQSSSSIKQVTLFVGFAAGSGADQHARILAREMSDILKVPVIIDNKPGGNGAVAYNAFRNAGSDSVNLMLTTSTTQVVNPILMSKLPFDPMKDLKPVAGLTRFYQVMLVRPDFPARTVAEFVAQAKARPGKFTFASGTSAAYLGAEMLKVLTGIDLLNVPYKATTNAISDLAGGAVDMMFADLPVAVPMIQSGRVRALAVGSAKRLSALPNVPTLQEAGVPGYEFSVWSGLYGLPSMSDEMAARMHDVASRALRSSPAEKFREGASLESFDAGPAELGRFQAADLARWREYAVKLGIKPE